MKIFGKNAVCELIKSNTTINKLYVSQDYADKDYLINKAKEKNIKFQITNKNYLDNLCDGGKHQGLLAEILDYKYADIDDAFSDAQNKNQDVFFLILDSLEDPHNLGSIARVAECAGVNGIIIAKNRSVCVNETVAKVSAGAIFHVNIIQVTNINNTIKELKNRGVFIYAADMDGVSMYKSNLKGKIALVVGGEGKGVSELVRKNCDEIISIPMKGEINSLNASVSAGIVVYEAIRQRKIDG